MTIPNQELHRIVTTAIIFRADARVLITRRALSKNVWPGKWTVPGGGLQTDDYTYRPPTHYGETNQWYSSLEYALRREVREETNLLIHTPWLVADLTFIRPDGTPVLVLSYGADLRLDNDDNYIVKLDADADQFAWVSLGEATEYDLIDGIYHELELAFEKWYGQK